MSLSKKRNLTVALMTAVVAVAQAGDIKGVVIDKEMNEPLMGASVRIAGTRIGTTADINGNFHLRGLKKGTYTLEVSYVSFFPQKLTLQVPAKGDVAVKVEMATDDKQLNEVTPLPRARTWSWSVPCWLNARTRCFPLKTLVQAKCLSKVFPTYKKE